MKKAIILFSLCSLFYATMARSNASQERLHSTKLIQGADIEELYQIAPTPNGYLCIGLKGEDASNKKLWLIELDANLNLLKSEVLTNQALNDPFRIINLPDQSRLLLAQYDQEGARKSIIFKLDKQHNIEWAKTLSDNNRCLYTDISMNQTKEFILTGKEFKEGSLAYDSDKLLWARMNLQGQIIESKKYDLGHAEITPKYQFIDGQNNVILNGTITQGGTDTKHYTKSWFCIKLAPTGVLTHHVILNNFANYTYASNMISYNGGYLAVINNHNYFGDAALIELDHALNIKGKATVLTGTPMLLSGLSIVNEKLLIGGVFSNTLKDNAPGFVLINPDRDEVISKSSTSLFEHFFITHITSLPEHQFMLSGIGYHRNEASDVYMLPFSSEGKSACELSNNSVQILKQDIASTKLEKISSVETNTLSSSIELVKTESGINIADICTAPDDYIIDPSQNTSWSSWQQNNRDAFTIKAPEDWFRISPLPARENVTISYLGMKQTDALRLTIMSSDGKIVFSEIYHNQDFFNVSISHLAPGTYFFNLYDGFETKVQKVIKE